ncbi:MAG TPA: hypothetical protein VFG97_03785 [Pedococcus sp.]|nr:hypothetical protein [Pedococcus sp.]
MAPDPLVGTDLTDGALKDEIELVGDLVVAASASEGPLSEAEIDEVLGIAPGRCAGRDETHLPTKRAFRTQRA